MVPNPLTVIVHLRNSFFHPFILWMLAVMRPWSSQWGILKLEKSGPRQQTNPFIILGANNVKHFHLQTSTEGGCTLCEVSKAEKVSVHTLSVCRHLVSFLAGQEPSFGSFRNFGFRAASVPLGQRNIAKGQRPVCLRCCEVEGQWTAKSPPRPGQHGKMVFSSTVRKDALVFCTSFPLSFCPLS